MIKRQEFRSPAKVLSIRMPMDLYNWLDDYAYRNKLTKAAVVTNMIKNSVAYGSSPAKTQYTPDEPVETSA